MAETAKAIPEPAVWFCPQCQSPLPGDARACPSCGVDLALLSLLGEKSFLDGLPKFAPMDTTPQWLVPRIGNFLIQQKVITEAQLDHALQVQKEASGKGERQLLGQTLLQLGYIDRETLDHAVTQQIVELHAALQESNRTLQQRVNERTKELRHALERLTEINQIKANLISNISHELRTPLAHIKGYVELLAEGELGALAEEQVDAVQVMRRATVRLATLIEDLIEFSTAAREGLTLRLSPVAVKELLTNAIERSRPKAEKAGVTLELECETDVPVVHVDDERLGWVLFQLIDNGIKFTPDGGRVRASARPHEAGVELAVSDTGIGIPPDRIEEIFQPFHQLDSSSTRRYGGTGLGLSLVKMIVDAHGAELKVESTEGEGTTIRFIVSTAA